MNWFVWFLIIIYAGNLGWYSARIGGYKPEPLSGWVGFVLNALILAGIIAYLT